MARHYAGYGRSLLEFQIVVFGALIIVGTAVVLTRSDTLDPTTYAAGAGFIVLVTAVTVIWRENALVQKFSLVLPLADIVGVRLTVLADLTQQASGALLLILPIIWIAYSFGPWGFTICLALVAVTSPQSFYAGYADYNSDDFTRLVAYPLILVILAGAAGVSGARIRRKRGQLAAQTALTEQAVRARDDLIEAVAHELRTPLTSILGNAELVLRTHEPQTVARRAGVIVRNAEQMETILADLLLARSTGTALLGLTRVPSDLRALIENCLAASRAAADARGVTIDLIASDTLWAEVDPHRIRQVLDNLLTNAIKYNRVGGTVVLSETRTTDTVTFAVTDSGCGMAPPDRALVFEPYYRTESARRSAQEGSGLGLGISRDIARRHGGDLRLVESSPTGSRFELSLPLAVADSENASAGSGRESGKNLA